MRWFVSSSAALMATPVSTTVTELPESRVRVEAEIPARRGGEARQRRRPHARSQHPRARLPRRQGAAAGGDQAHRPRGGARRGRPRIARTSWYRAAIDDAHVVPVGEPDLDLGELRRARASRCASRSRSACARRRRSATTRASRSASARPRCPTRAIAATSSSACASARPSSRPSTARRQRGDFVVMDFAGSVDGEPFAGGEGRDQMIELGSRPARPRLRGAARGRERAARSARSRSPSPTTTRPTELAGQDGGVRGHRPRGQGQGAARRSTTSWPREAGFDTLDELREDIRSRLGEDETPADRGRVPRGGARRGGQGGHGRGAGRAGRGAGARAVGLDAALARRTRASTATTYLRSPAARRRR